MILSNNFKQIVIPTSIISISFTSLTNSNHFPSPALHCYCYYCCSCPFDSVSVRTKWGKVVEVSSHFRTFCKKRQSDIVATKADILHDFHLLFPCPKKDGVVNSKFCRLTFSFLCNKQVNLNTRTNLIVFFPSTCFLSHYPLHLSLFIITS